MLRTKDIGFNFPYHGKFEDYQSEGNKLHSHLTSKCEAFCFQLEKNPNIKDSYHWQGYMHLPKHIERNILLNMFSEFPGGKHPHFDFLNSGDHVSNCIKYCQKVKTRVGRQYKFGIASLLILD